MFLFKLNFIITGFKIEKAARNNHPFIPSFPTYFPSRIIRKKKKTENLLPMRHRRQARQLSQSSAYGKREEAKTETCSSDVINAGGRTNRQSCKQSSKNK